MSLVNETLGEYKIEKIIGHGTMAEVYLAKHITRAYPVAIKVIHAHLLNDPTFVERFKREANILGELDHPHIIHLYSYDFSNNQAYIVMEYLSGGTLADRMKEFHDRKEHIPLGEVLQIIEPIASAVDYAHEHDLVHRDLKPANILFRENDDAVLTDFGLAFMMNDPRLSASNTITGTPAYLSPEQAKGMPGDGRSDIYALGIILYEMFSGYTPFQGNVISVVMKHISDAPPSIRSFGRYLPKRIEDVVLKALDKQPHRRYQSAQMMVRDLRKAIEKTLPEALTNEENQIDLVEWEKNYKDQQEQIKDLENAGVVESSPPPPPEDTLIAEPITVEKEISSTPAPQAETPPGIQRPYVTNPTTSTRVTDTLEIPRRNRRRETTNWVSVITILSIILIITAALFFLIPNISNSVPTGNNPDAGPAKYTVGQRTLISIPGGASTSVYNGCRTLFGGQVIGMASDGQVAVVKSRMTCGEVWYYQIFIKDAVSKDWDGIGYIPANFLK